MVTRLEALQSITHTYGALTLQLKPKLWPLLNSTQAGKLRNSGYLSFDITSTTLQEATATLKLLPPAYMFDIVRQALSQLGNKAHTLCLPVSSQMLNNRELYVIFNQFSQCQFHLVLPQTELPLVDKARLSRLIRYHSKVPPQLIIALNTLEPPHYASMATFPVTGVMLSRALFWHHYQQHPQKLGFALDKLVSRFHFVVVDGIDTECFYRFIKQHQASGIGYYRPATESQPSKASQPRL